MNIAIIGAGLIGQKRAVNLPKGVKLYLVCDKDEVKGQKMAKDFNCLYEKDWKKIVKNPEIKAVIVATTHNWLGPIAVEAIKNKKHVFIEKPGAINLAEFKKIIKAYKKNNVVVAIGYNHRYHPAIIKAKEVIESCKYGKVMFIRGRYGHGARLGYEKEWRFDKKLSGGGELIDQGSHLIDLSNYFIGPMKNLTGFLGTMFWKTKLEDSAFFQMKNNEGQIASFSVTCVEWKNIFSLEIMLKTAKIQIDGLGRSYGKEHLILYKMKPEMGIPEVEEFDFPEEDNSWRLQNEIFFNRIKNKDYSPTDLEDGEYVLKIIKKLYALV